VTTPLLTEDRRNELLKEVLGGKSRLDSTQAESTAVR
jgi:hypothetical protein